MIVIAAMRKGHGDIERACVCPTRNLRSQSLIRLGRTAGSLQDDWEEFQPFSVIDLLLHDRKRLEAENAKLKRMYADLALENAAIKDVLSRKL